MKTINYRGGLVRFRIPSDWVEEYEEEGGGTFYLDEDNSPTLRLNVLTFKAPAIIDESFAAESLRSSAEKRGTTVRVLPSGCAAINYQEEDVDQGDPVVMYYWQVCNAAPPQHCHLAVFSLTTLQSQKFDQSILEMVKMIDEEINQCSVASTPGE